MQRAILLRQQGLKHNIKYDVYLCFLVLRTASLDKKTETALKSQLSYCRLHDATVAIKASGSAYLSAIAPMEPFWYSRGASASSEGIMDATCRRQNKGIHALSGQKPQMHSELPDH